MSANNIKPIRFEDEMQDSYLSYALSVVTSRAVADVRDGLKPVHRRILWSLYTMGCFPNKPHRKSARINGDVTGKYHPHGTTAVYDAMIRLSQDFSMRIQLVDCQGNNGSIDGDKPAADRYTEVRLTQFGEMLMEGINEDTVDFRPNYDYLSEEPSILPAAYPVLLVNGTTGIAVGMSTNIPTHNPTEVLSAAIALLKNPEISIDQLLEIMPGPDFPTSGILTPKQSLRQAYHTGKGSLTLRGQCEVDDHKIVIYEIPYQVNKSKLVERIAELIHDKIIEGVSDLRDESDRNGIRIVIELKKHAAPQQIVQKLYSLTPLQVNIPIQMSAIYRERPRLFNLKEILEIFLEFREEIVVRRTKFRLRKIAERLHILSGLALALDAIDEVIVIVRNASDPQDAKFKLCAMEWSNAQLSQIRQITSSEMKCLSEIQAQSILDLKLQRLTKLERNQILTDLQDLVTQSKALREILNNRQHRLELIESELQEVSKKLSTPRKTKIEFFDSDLTEESAVPKEEMLVTITANGYIKRTQLHLYRTQHRGGKGRSGMKNDEVISKMFVAHTLQPVLFFSKLGKVYSKKVYMLPNATVTAKGKSLLSMIPENDISTILAIADAPQKGLLFATASGKVRRNDIADFSKIRADGKIAIKLDKDDSLISVCEVSDSDTVILATKKGKAIRFNASEVRVMSSRDSSGVKGIDLDSDDAVVSAHVLPQDMQLLAVSEKGFGKRTNSANYRISHRGGKGVITFNISKKTGDICCVIPVTDNDDILLITNEGQVIRIKSDQIREASRNTSGVRLMNTEDTVSQVIAAIAGEESE
jgi:DNA gyrase subunit A